MSTKKCKKNHKDKDARIIAKQRVDEGMPWIRNALKKRGARVVQKVL